MKSEDEHFKHMDLKSNIFSTRDLTVQILAFNISTLERRVGLAEVKHLWFFSIHELSHFSTKELLFQMLVLEIRTTVAFGVVYTNEMLWMNGRKSRWHKHLTVNSLQMCLWKTWFILSPFWERIIDDPREERKREREL